MNPPTVDEVMTQELHVCSRDQTAEAALRLMYEHDCGCVPIVEDGVVVGIVTDRDLALAVAAHDLRPSQVRLEQVMSGHVFIVRPETSLAEAEAVMRQQRIRRIPVVDASSRLIGLLSLADLARAGAEQRWQSDGAGLSALDIAGTMATVMAGATWSSEGPRADHN